VAFLLFINDVHGMGLKVAQGLQLLEAFYWDQNDETRAFAKRFAARPGMMARCRAAIRPAFTPSTLALSQRRCRHRKRQRQKMLCRK